MPDEKTEQWQRSRCVRCTVQGRCVSEFTQMSLAEGAVRRLRDGMYVVILDLCPDCASSLRVWLERMLG